MCQATRVAFVATSLPVLYYLGAAVLDRLLYLRNAGLHGCQEARKYPYWEPFFSLDLSNQRCQRTRRQRVYLAEIKRQYAVYGKTHEIRFLNARMIRSMDPKNTYTTRARLKR